MRQTGLTAPPGCCLTTEYNNGRAGARPQYRERPLEGHGTPRQVLTTGSPGLESGMSTNCTTAK